MNSKHILITGGSGFLGAALCDLWLRQGWQITVLSRNPADAAKHLHPAIKITTNLQTLSADSRFDVIVNLAGAPIFGGRWSLARKLLLRDSRIAGTENLLAFIAGLKQKPEVLLSGSAIGIYGNRGNTLLTEASPGKTDFSQQLCSDWEAAALQAENLGVRVCLIRTGLVLDQQGGMLQNMLPAYRLGLGGKLGSGQQWMSWIHRKDWLAGMDFLVQHPELSGPFNFTAPAPVTNAEFSAALAKQLHRPALLNLPAPLLQALLGEMAELVLGSQRVSPERLLSSGFSFAYPALEAALADIFGPH
ncbi:TIGR01777 family oxidoreductase [Methylomonas paludis]|uniref:TIGR01777 family oxidoreductase n=1 Tax=Methylomonas paludis TaxID=1173101 RepID=A0A975MPZ1_9GAMM|nr:TIGR01777 family oxidoreductase [Methylomonas paludis]QWF71334.1 TIGR01777 family oxidoreductase [Methylomonas paludis]